MKVKIKLFDTELPLPSYQSKGAACIDLYARVEIRIKPKTLGYIPLNVALEIPNGYWVMVAARGSTHKQGLMPAHGIGIGDWDFKGDNDEYHFPVYNLTESTVVILRGQRIAQAMIMPFEKIELELVKQLGNADRGKFGSTGNL